MNWIQGTLMTMAMKLLQMALPMITEGMRKLLVEMLDKLEAYSISTESGTFANFDNVLVAFLRAILGIPGKEEEAPCDPISGEATVKVTGPVVAP